MNQIYEIRKEDEDNKMQFAYDECAQEEQEEELYCDRCTDAGCNYCLMLNY